MSFITGWILGQPIVYLAYGSLTFHQVFEFPLHLSQISFQILFESSLSLYELLRT